jgi:hypothetical protein
MNTDYEVKCFSGAIRMQSELMAAFDLVADKGNWKLAIDKTVRWNIDRELITDAVVHFTGSVPGFTITGAWLRVTAAGYYAAVGA